MVAEQDKRQVIKRPKCFISSGLRVQTVLYPLKKAAAAEILLFLLPYELSMAYAMATERSKTLQLQNFAKENTATCVSHHVIKIV